MILTLEALLTHQRHPSVELKRGQPPQERGKRPPLFLLNACLSPTGQSPVERQLEWASSLRVSTLLDTKLLTPHLKLQFITCGNSVWTCYRCFKHHRRYVEDGDCATYRAPTHRPVGIEGIRTHASTSLLRLSAGVLWLASNRDWRSRSLKFYLKLESSRIKLVGLG